MFQHTTEALALHAGFAKDTILKWRALGLFDGIETSLTGGGKGKGVQLLWHADAMARVDEILALKSQGYNMERLQAKFRKRPAKKRKKAKKRKASKRATP
ncbi:hypothetical protein OV079_02610 [Nannocystis pusilla]|uniref:Uncharacterized protein n=1 Tax=Nannocystis pusilla TaxID=889268 RepID=A0A9X3EI25_9BACT|nr:hypothetical protein [Nannocystis pusilla]MCY1004478.1 hypothetical protein [Nannocystis pusilla]